ncbi:hypothetical protein KSS87_018328 [Heliosperma pusillum]|nr:hypothetical protein KSS87_020215 [Heliosperma pusillum]KAH9621878.1 hypothetical protein KSS87_018328 [Heliosperma pusillum]
MRYRSRVFRYHQTLLLLPPSIVARPPPCCSPSRVAQVVAPGQHRAPLLQVRIIIKLSTIKEMDLTEQMCRCAGKQTEDLTSDKSFSMTNGRGERDFERKVYIMCNCATHVHISVSLLNCLRTRPSHLLLGVVDIN